MPDTIESSRNSEISPTFAVDQQNHLIIVDGINTSQRWNGTDSSTTLLGIAAPTAAPTVTTPTGGAATAGAYILYYRFKDVDGNYSSISPEAAVTAATNDKFSWDTIPSSSDSRVTNKELLRSASGDSVTLFVVATITNATTSHQDTLSDTTLQANTAHPILNADGTENLERFDPPPTKQFVVAFFDRFYYFGDAVYDAGTVELTNASTAIVGRGVNWTSEMKGRKIYFDGETTEYEVSAVGSSTSITLTANFTGTTALFNDYAIKPAKTERRKVYYTSVAEPESVRDLDFVIPADGDEDYTGGYALRNYLFICEPKRTWRFFIAAMAGRASSNNRPGVGLQHAIDRGLINNRCWIRVENVTYCMDQDGAYVFDGSQQKDISHPIQDFFRDERINFAASRWFFVSLDPAAEVVRFHVSLGEGYLPRHALIYHYRHQRWEGIEEYPWDFGGWCLPNINGRKQPIFGSEFGKHYLSEGTYDGPIDFTIRGQATSATALSITDTSSDAIIPSRNIVGSTLALVAGRGEGQVRRIISESSGVITVNRPLQIIPDPTTHYQIGGVPWLSRFGIFKFPDTPSDSENTRETVLVAQPTVNDASLSLRRYLDHSDVPKNYQGEELGKGVVTTSGQPDAVMNLKQVQTQGTFSGRRHLNLGGYTGGRRDSERFVQYEIRGVQGSDRIRVFELDFEGTTEK